MMFFDPGVRPGFMMPLSDEEIEKLNKKYYCKQCNAEIEGYEHSWQDEKCDECYKKSIWVSIKRDYRVKIKYSRDSKVPKKLHGLWVTIEGFNNRNNPVFYCPLTDKPRVLSFSNMDQAHERYKLR